MCKMASLCKRRGAAAEAAPRPTRGRAGEPFEAVERLLLYIQLLYTMPMKTILKPCQCLRTAYSNDDD